MIATHHSEEKPQTWIEIQGALQISENYGTIDFSRKNVYWFIAVAIYSATIRVLAANSSKKMEDIKSSSVIRNGIEAWQETIYWISA